LPARGRAEVDEWVVGVRIICTVCEEKKQKCRETLSELEDDDEATEEELEEAKAAVAAAQYMYRSYNPISMKLYAERYPWCACAEIGAR
jgi:hypothetical protein